jgi:serine/threonine protein kinase
MGQDIGQGLKYLHGRNIVHADLKSLNVLLDKEKHALLADFGLASVKKENMEQYYQDTTKAKGSLLWMAPELFEQGRHTFATDMYSFGVVLWEIATHHLPFQEFNWEVPVLIAQISKGTRDKFPEDTPGEYQDLAKKCWDGDPKTRPNAIDTAEILAALWKRAGGVDDKVMEKVDASSPSYLTGTVASPYEGKSSYDQAQTKFGV